MRKLNLQPHFPMLRKLNLVQTNTLLIACLPWLLLMSRTLADLCVVGFGLHFLLRCYRQHQWSVFKQTWVKAAGLFFLYLALINSAQSLHPIDSMIHSFFFLRWPLFALAFASQLKQDNIKTLFFKSMTLACLALMFDCVWQYSTGHDLLGKAIINDRLTGPYHAPLPGIMLVRVLFIASLYFLFKPIKFSRVIQPMLWLLTLIVILLAGERMAMLLCLLGILCISITLAYGDTTWRKPLLWALLAVSGVSVTLLASQPQIAQRMGWSLLDKLSHFAQSDYGLVFRAAWAAWQQQPLFGHGLHTYKEVCESMGLLHKWALLQDWNMSCTHPHNLYLLLGAETGLLGVMLFSGMILLIYKQTVMPLYQTKQWALLGHVLAILTLSFFPLIGGVSLWSNWVAAIAWTGVGVCLSLSPSRTAVQHPA